MNPGELWTVWSAPSIFLQGNGKWHMDTNGRCIACIAYQQWNQSLITSHHAQGVSSFLHKFAFISTFFQAAQRRCSCQYGERTSQSALLSWRCHPCPCGSGSHHWSANQPLHPGQHLRCECCILKKRDGFFKMFLNFIIILCAHTFCWTGNGSFDLVSDFLVCIKWHSVHFASLPFLLSLW